MQYLDSMKNFLRSDIGKNLFIYSIGALFLKGIAFLLIPVYTAVLPPSEYGKLELVGNFGAVLNTVLSFGLCQVAFIEYYHLNVDERKAMVRNLLSIYCFTSTPVFIVALMAGVVFKTFIFKDDLASTLIILAVAGSYLLFYQDLFFSILRISAQAARLTVTQIILGIFTGLLNIYLVYWLRTGITGILMTNIAIFLLSIFYAWIRYKKEIGAFRFTVEKAVWIKYLKLGIPFVPGAFASWIMIAGNRWVLLYYLDEASVGLYGLAFKFGMVFEALIVSPVITAYMPYIFKKYSEKKYGQQLSFVFPTVLAAFVILGLLTMPVAKMFINKNYYAAIPLIPYIVTGYGFLLMNYLVSTIILFRKKIYYHVSIAVAASLMSIAINFVLIPKFGIFGAAYSSLVVNIIWFLMYFIYARKLKIELKKETAEA